MFPAAPRSLGAEDGTYTGSLVSGMPDGEGVFTLASGASFTGEFSGGTAGTRARQPICRGHCCTAAAAFPPTLTSESAWPEGEGALRRRERRRAAVHLARRLGAARPRPGVFDVTSTASSPSKAAKRPEATPETAADGLPDGEGVFTGESETGVPFTYTGEWSAGLMDGKGNAFLRRGKPHTRTGIVHRRALYAGRA